MNELIKPNEDSIWIGLTRIPGNPISRPENAGFFAVHFFIMAAFRLQKKDMLI